MKYENYLIVDVAILALLITSIFAVIHKSQATILTSTFTFLALFYWIKQFTPAKVDNETGDDIKIKDEDSDEVRTVRTGESAKHIDGVKIGTTVYKIPDGVRITATADGIKTHSITGFILYRLRGGDFSGWNKIFCE